MLRKKRKEINITQSKLAKNLGITKGYLSKLEKYPSLCNPSINLILKISKELDLDPVEIFLFFIDKKISIHKN